MIADQIKQLEKVISRDIGRNIEELTRAASGELLRAAQSIAEHPAPNVGIVTGFYIPDADPPAPESDGLLGAVDLIRILRALQIPVLLITDSFCKTALKSALDLLNPPTPLLVGDDISDVSNLRQDLHFRQLSHLIAVERPGPAASGRVFNMRGRDITSTTPPLHPLFIGNQSWRTIGIGDGGNEIGMGKWPLQTFAGIEHGKTIACRVGCDFSIVCGVSNWGAPALAGAVALFRRNKTALRQFKVDLTGQVLQHLVKNRLVVDGVLGVPQMSVDGLAWPDHERLSQNLFSIALG